MYALCKSTLSGGLQAEAMTHRRSFLKHYLHANIQSNKVCALWKYTECGLQAEAMSSKGSF